MIVPKADPMSLQFCLVVCKRSTHKTTVVHTHTHRHSHKDITESTNLTLLQLITWGPSGNVGDNFSSFIHSPSSLKQRQSARYVLANGWQCLELSWMALNWTNLNQIKLNSGELSICMFVQHLCICMCLSLCSPMKMHAERPIWVGRKTNTARHPEKRQTYQYDRCKQEHLYCVCVFLSHSISLSAVNQWSVRTSFKLSHSINTGSIDFFKQLMEAFRAGKLIKIICRSSSFKDSPLVYVELNHAWLENPSIGHRNWLVFLMAFQCSCIS